MFHPVVSPTSCPDLVQLCNAHNNVRESPYVWAKRIYKSIVLINEFRGSCMGRFPETPSRYHRPLQWIKRPGETDAVFRNTEPDKDLEPLQDVMEMYDKYLVQRYISRWGSVEAFLQAGGLEISTGSDFELSSAEEELEEAQGEDRW